MITIICVSILVLLFFSVALSIKFKEGVALTSSWHVKLYKSLWCIEGYHRLPSNICSYFWKYLLGIMLLPFTWIVVNIFTIFKKTRNTISDAFVGVVITTNVLILYHLTAGNMMLYDTLSGLSILQFMKGIGLSFIILCSIIFILFLGGFIGHIATMARNKRSGSHRTESLLVTRFKDWKNKSCTRITWSD